MKPRRLSLTVALLGVSMLVGVNAARACKYCWAAEAAAGDLSQQALLQQDQTAPPGTFPLDSTISQFKPAPAPATLATPPPTGSIVTSAADLRTTTVVPTAKISFAPATVQSAVAPTRASGHFADAGLLGLATVGGVFCWRTRRKTGPGR